MRVKLMGVILGCMLCASTAYAVDSEVLLNLQDPSPDTFGITGGGGSQAQRVESRSDDSSNPTVKLPTIDCVATAASPSYTEGNIVPCSTDLSGNLRISITGSGGGAQRESFTVFTAVIDPRASTDYLTVFNGAGSGQIVRVTEIDVRTDFTGGMTGRTIPATYSKTTTSGTTCTPVTINPYDSTNTAVPGTIVANSVCTVDPVVDFDFGQCTYRSEENPNGGENNRCWDYDSSRETQPIVLREGEGLMLRQNAFSPPANNDRIRVRFEVTINPS